MEDEDENYEQYEQYEQYDYDSYQWETKQKPFNIISCSLLVGQIFKMAQETSQLVALEVGWCLLLLKEFKWNPQYVSNSYFNNPKSYQNKIRYSINLKPSKELEWTPKQMCGVCCQETMLISNICGDSFCLDCWMNHIKTSFSSLNPFPLCMECSTPLLYETIRNIIKVDEKNNQLQLRYQRLLSEEFCTSNRLYKFCAGIDCVNCIKIIDQNVKFVTCTCGKSFCFNCNSDDHSPCSCEQKKSWCDMVLTEQANAKWLSLNAKLCPWCKKAVQRSSGCNYISCFCGKSFCYMCQKPWQPDHKDHFKCHIYKKSSNSQKDKTKQVLKIMNFYTQKFLYNQAAVTYNKSINTFQKRKCLFAKLGIGLLESEFIDLAYKFMIECCESLKWIYAYSYFINLKKGNEKQKQGFEYSQGQFEMYKENLAKKLAIDLTNFLKKIEKIQETKVPYDKKQLIDQFLALKKSIVNYYTATKSHIKKFIDSHQELQSMEIPLKVEKSKSRKNQKKKMN